MKVNESSYSKALQSCRTAISTSHPFYKFRIATQTTLEESLLGDEQRSLEIQDLHVTEQEEIQRLNREVGEMRKQVLAAELARAQEIKEIRRKMDGIEVELSKEKEYSREVANRNCELEAENQRLTKLLRLAKGRVKDEQYVHRKQEEQLTIKSRFLQTAQALKKRNMVESTNEITIKRQKRVDFYHQQAPATFKPTQTFSSILSHARPNRLISDNTFRLESKIKSLDRQIKKSREKLNEAKNKRFQY